MEQLVEIVELKKRSDVHLARKIWHMGGVSLMAAIYASVPEKMALMLLALAWLTFVPVDVLRQKNEKLNQLLVTAFKPIMRKSEVDRLAGTSYLISGVTLVAFIFPREVVLLTFLFLAFADPLASYFGIKYGKDKIFGEKSLQGSLAAFFVCAILTFCFLTYNGILLDRIVMFSLFAGLAGSLAELIPIWKIDDNFTLPVLSASALWLLFTLFGAFGSYL